ncbi:MAG: serine/threonine protein kinase [Polyangiaceae bacterium]|nr:serine/threonine protein kinase [Polyangiaceae bacterium]
MNSGDDAQASLVGQTIAGKYKVVRLLGEGGMGCVYLAEQQLGSAARKVALKTLHKHLSHDASIQARFDREAGTVAGLEHPNTIQVFDYGKMDDGTLYIVMEFVQGRSVGDILEKDGPMPPARVEHIMKQICGSLEEAHNHGIIHRDLKPDNVVLCERAGQKDWVEVLDFGIAKRSTEQDPNEAKLTQQGMVLGTPPYMSPEQFTGQPIDKRSDIYALGIMAYEMLTACLPFKANTAWEWASKHMTEMPTPLERQPLGAHVPPAMRAAIMKALAKNRDDRFSSVKQFIDAFTADSAASASAVSVANSPNAFANTVAMDAPPPNVVAPAGPQTEMVQPMGMYTPPPATPWGPSSGMGGPGQAPYPQPPYSPPPKKGKGLVIVLGALALVLLGGGALAAVFSRKPPPPPQMDLGVDAAATIAPTTPPTEVVPPPQEQQEASVTVPALETGKSAQPPAAVVQPKPPTPPTPPANPTPNVNPVPVPPPPQPPQRPFRHQQRTEEICAQARSARSRRQPAAIIAALENRCREQGGNP